MLQLIVNRLFIYLFICNIYELVKIFQPEMQILVVWLNVVP